MRNPCGRLWLWAMAAGVMTVVAGFGEAGPTAPDAKIAEITVTVCPRHRGASPVVTPDDVRVYEDNQSRPVVSWVATKMQPHPLDLTILMDDSIKARVGLQFKDLANFLPTLPSGTRVRVAYASFGGSRVTQNFTRDYRLAADALRIPVGPIAAGGSIYQSVEYLIKSWPSDGNRRALLFISDGIDLDRGYEYSRPDLNIDLQAAIDVAQTSEVPVYTLFVRGPSSLERNWLLLDNGQGCLSRLASETGGQFFYEGTRTPLAFAPYLKQISNDLHHQYVLAFRHLPAPRVGYQRLHVTTEIPNVRLLAPTRVFIP